MRYEPKNCSGINIAENARNLSKQLTHAESVIAWQKREIERLKKHIGTTPCTCAYAGDGDCFTCARCDALGIIK